MLKNNYWKIWSKGYWKMTSLQGQMIYSEHLKKLVIVAKCPASKLVGCNSLKRILLKNMYSFS